MFSFQNKVHKASRKKTLDLAYLNKRTPSYKPILFLVPAAIIIFAFTLYPLFYSLRFALVDDGSFTWDNVDFILNDNDFMKSLTNSLLYAAIQLPLSMMISLVISAAIAGIVRKALRGAWQTIFFLPYITSGIAVGIAFSYLFSEAGLVNQIFGLDHDWLNTNDRNSYMPLFIMIVNGVWRALAFQVLIFTTAMLGVDKDRYRSAAIDGAGRITQFFQITLPSIRRTFNFIIIVGLIGAIKIFPLALFDNEVGSAFRNGGGTLMLYVYYFIRGGAGAVNFAYAGAASLLLLFISITYSSAIRNSFNYLNRFIAYRKEKNVRTKIKTYSISKS